MSTSSRSRNSFNSCAAFELRRLGLGGELAARVGHLHGKALREILVGPESGDEDPPLGTLPRDDLGDDGPDRLRRDRLVAQLLERVDRLAEDGQEVAHRRWHALRVELQELLEDRRAVERIRLGDGIRRARRWLASRSHGSGGLTEITYTGEFALTWSFSARDRLLRR